MRATQCNTCPPKNLKIWKDGSAVNLIVGPSINKANARDVRRVCESSWAKH